MQFCSVLAREKGSDPAGYTASAKRFFALENPFPAPKECGATLDTFPSPSLSCSTLPKPDISFSKLPQSLCALLPKCYN